MGASISSNVEKPDDIMKENNNTMSFIGSIHPSISNISSANNLIIKFNTIERDIFDSIGNYTNLTSLTIIKNKINGQIPHSIGNLSRLEVLKIIDNSLYSSIPYEIGNLTNLVQLILNNNNFIGTIPNSIGNITCLQILALHNNLLQGSIPDSIINLSKLKYLILSQNKLSGSIPLKIGNLVQLRKLVISGNQLTGTIPSSIGNLIYLNELYLHNNMLEGEIPSTIGNLSNLIKLSLGDNNFDGDISSSIPKLISLQYLWCNDNKLNGYIESIIELKNLVSLRLGNNKITGTIPSSLGDLINLNELRLYSNKLYGSIPSTIGNLINLRVLSLDDNMLTGRIPNSLGNLTNLEEIYLHRNKLEGNIPSSFGNMSKLITLSLGWNNLTGNIPSTFSNLTNLKNLYVHFNYLDLNLSKENCPPNITTLSLGNDILEYLTIPDSISLFKKLNTLILRFDHLKNETIPSSIRKLQNLETIIISKNIVKYLPPIINMKNLSKMYILRSKNDSVNIGHPTLSSHQAIVDYLNSNNRNNIERDEPRSFYSLIISQINGSSYYDPYCDFEITIGDRVWHLHKFILFVRCQNLMDETYNDKLKSVTNTAFIIFLKWIYHGNIPSYSEINSEDNSVQILKDLFFLFKEIVQKDIYGFILLLLDKKLKELDDGLFLSEFQKSLKDDHEEIVEVFYSDYIKRDQISFENRNEIFSLISQRNITTKIDLIDNMNFVDYEDKFASNYKDDFMYISRHRPLSDIIFMFDENNMVSAHKAIIIDRCPYIMKGLIDNIDQLSDPSMDAKFNMENYDLTFKAFKNLIDYYYCNEYLLDINTDYLDILNIYIYFENHRDAILGMDENSNIDSVFNICKAKLYDKDLPSNIFTSLFNELVKNHSNKHYKSLLYDFVQRIRNDRSLIDSNFLNKLAKQYLDSFGIIYQVD